MVRTSPRCLVVGARAPRPSIDGWSDDAHVHGLHRSLLHSRAAGPASAGVVRPGRCPSLLDEGGPRLVGRRLGVGLRGGGLVRTLPGRDTDEATSFAGTGALVHEDRLLFCTGSDIRPGSCLRVEDALLVSNSLVFLQVMAGGRPDPSYGYYGGETLLQCVLGTNRTRRTLPTSSGGTEVHECVNLEVRHDLTLRRVARPRVKTPMNYQECIDLLDGAMCETFANAADPARVRTFAPVATLSRGYDCTFVAALAARHGCTDGLTFIDSSPHAGREDLDSGVELGRLIEWRSVSSTTSTSGRTAVVGIEFLVHPPGIDHPLASFEGSLGRMSSRVRSVVACCPPAWSICCPNSGRPRFRDCAVRR